MKVCHLVYGAYPFDPRVRREVDSVRRHGVVAHVIAARDPLEQASVGEDQVPTYRIPLPIVRGGKARYAYQYIVFFLTSAALLFRLNIRERFDVVHIHSLPDFLVFVALPLRLFGVRLILDLHEAMPEILAARFGLQARHPLVRFAQILEWASCAVATRVIVVNERIAELLANRGTNSAKVTIVMNSPDSHLITVARGTASSPPQPPPFNDGRLLVYVGGLNAERDLELLVRACARLRSTHDVRLAVYGYGDSAYRSLLETVAADEDFLGAFFLGPRLPQEAVLSYIRLSEIGPITYVRNPLTEIAIPNKVFEYAAMGKPLVIADLTCLKGLFGDAAIYYRPGDVDDLARKIASLLDDPNRARILAERAGAVLDRCRWGIMEERLLTTYRDGGRR